MSTGTMGERFPFKIYLPPPEPIPSMAVVARVVLMASMPAFYLTVRRPRSRLGTDVWQVHVAGGKNNIIYIRVYIYKYVVVVNRPSAPPPGT